MVYFMGDGKFLRVFEGFERCFFGKVFRVEWIGGGGGLGRKIY